MGTWLLRKRMVALMWMNSNDECATFFRRRNGADVTEFLSKNLPPCFSKLARGSGIRDEPLLLYKYYHLESMRYVYRRWP